MTAFDVGTNLHQPQVKLGLTPSSPDADCCGSIGGAGHELHGDDLIGAPPSTSLILSPSHQHTNSPPAEFYEAAIQSAGNPVIGLDRAGMICCWNQSAERMFGRTESEMIGHTMDSLVPMEYRPIAWRALQRTLQQRSVNTYEMAMIPPGGKNALHLGVTLSCVLGADGQCQGVMAWMRDISTRKELESNLSRTRHIASLGTLAAGVAHHFNNIVCGMNTMVELALSTEDESSMRRALQMSAEASSRISYITQSLLAFSTPESGEPDLADLTEEVLRFADAIEPTLKKKGIELILELKANRIAAVPRHRFGQMLQHLLKNAEEAFECCEGGQVKSITIATQSQGEQIMLQFSDTGCGVSSEDLPQLFDPFFTTKSVRCGGNKANPGLGLTLAHGVVMDMGGHIWADSVVGKRTAINILIPVTL